MCCEQMTNMALQFHINVPLNRPPDRMWRRPRNKWLDQLRNDSTRPTGHLWRRAVDRRYGGARRDGPRRLHELDDDDDNDGEQMTMRSLMTCGQ